MVDTNTLIWVLVSVIGLLIIMNLALILMTKRNHKREQEKVPDTLPPLGVMSYTQPEVNLKEMLQHDIGKKKERILAIKMQAKDLESEMLKLKDSVKELEAMRGDVL